MPGCMKKEKECQGILFRTYRSSSILHLYATASERLLCGCFSRIYICKLVTVNFLISSSFFGWIRYSFTFSAFLVTSAYLIFYFLFWFLFKVASFFIYFFSRLSRLVKNGHNSLEDCTVEHVDVQFFR